MPILQKLKCFLSNLVSRVRGRSMSNRFDRIEFEKDIKELMDLRTLYLSTEGLAKRRLQGEISPVEYDECMELVKTRMQAISAIRSAMQ